MSGQLELSLVYAQRTALITGASSGIGAAFAEALAARDCRLVLTARRVDRLRALAQRLGERYGSECLCIEADLADETALDAIDLRLRAQSINIDILINNAGYGIPGQFHKHAWTAHTEFLQVLLIRPTELVHRFLPGMQERGWGRIVNVASLAGLIPGSNGNTLYAASKSYLIKFSQSLALENRRRGVLVQALCPGFTESEFHDVSGARHLMQRLPKFMFQSADAVVEECLPSLERGQVVHVSGRINRLLAWIAKHAPERLSLYLIERRSKDFRVLD